MDWIAVKELNLRYHNRELFRVPLKRSGGDIRQVYGTQPQTRFRRSD